MSTTTTPERIIRGGRTVPWITMWSEEHLDRSGRRGLSLIDGRTTLTDPIGYRYYRGLVWQDEPDMRGRGTPLWAQVHTGRAARAMEKALCQVCGGPASRDDGTIPWILPTPREPRGGQLITEDPPTCDECTTEALSSCPALHTPVTLLVTAHRLTGWTVQFPVVPTDSRSGTRWVYDREQATGGVVKRRLAGITEWTSR